MKRSIAFCSIVSFVLGIAACGQGPTDPEQEAEGRAAAEAEGTADSNAQQTSETQMATESEQTAGAGHMLTAAMTGKEEVPGPGDEDGTGTAQFTHNADTGELCYELTVQNIDAANAAHIHSGPAGQAGPPVMPLETPAQGSSKGCGTPEQKVLQDILANPGNYYVNVHNPAFPAGAVRGQLAQSE